MKKLLILFLFVSTQVLAQSGRSHTWEIEIDPIAYALKGYSFHGIYQPGRLRFDAGVYGIHIPESFHGNKGFDVSMQGVGLKTHYLIQGTRGLYTGAGVGYSRLKATYTETEVTDKGQAIGIGPEIGYRFFFQKAQEGQQRGLYLAPWVSLSYNFITDKIQVPGHNYKQKELDFFPTVHIGYRF